MPLPFAFLNRKKFPTNLNLRHFMIISKFALMRQGMTLEDRKLTRLFKRLCRKYKTGNTLPKAILAKHVNNSVCGCSGCWVGLCPTKMLHQDYTIGVNSSETHNYPLHISEGVTLTVHGNLVSNLMTVAGTLIVHGTHTHKNLTILKTGRYHVHGTSSASPEAAKTTIDTDTTNKYLLKNTGTFTVEKGATYTNNSSAMFMNYNIVDIFGTFVNKGTYETVKGTTTVETSATFMNNYDYDNFSTTVINGTFHNNYNTSNTGTMTINGTFNNNNASEFDNGAVDDSVDFGILTLNGTFNNTGLFNSYNVLSSITLSTGSNFTNYNTFTNESSLLINGTFTNSNDNKFDNNGATTINGTFTFNNTFTNYSVLVINGTFTNKNNKPFINNGTATINVPYTNNSTFSNYSIMTLNGDFTNNNQFTHGIFNTDDSSLNINGAFINNNQFDNYSTLIFNGTYTTISTSYFYNHFNAIVYIRAPFTNTGTLTNGSSIHVIGKVLTNYNVITILSGCNITFFDNAVLHMEGGAITQNNGGIIMEEGTYSGSTTSIVTLPDPDYVLHHVSDTATTTEHYINSGGEAGVIYEQGGIYPDSWDTVTVYNEDGTTFATVEYLHATSFIDPCEQTKKVDIKVTFETGDFGQDSNGNDIWFIPGNAYRIYFKFETATSLHKWFHTSQTWYPFVYSPE
jgi:hypothetical protein